MAEKKRKKISQWIEKKRKREKKRFLLAPSSLIHILANSRCRFVFVYSLYITRWITFHQKFSINYLFWETWFSHHFVHWVTGMCNLIIVKFVDNDSIIKVFVHRIPQLQNSFLHFIWFPSNRCTEFRYQPWMYHEYENGKLSWTESKRRTKIVFDSNRKPKYKWIFH